MTNAVPRAGVAAPPLSVTVTAAGEVPASAEAWGPGRGGGGAVARAGVWPSPKPPAAVKPPAPPGGSASVKRATMAVKVPPSVALMLAPRADRGASDTTAVLFAVADAPPLSNIATV